MAWEKWSQIYKNHIYLSGLWTHLVDLSLSKDPQGISAWCYKFSTYFFHFIQRGFSWEIYWWISGQVLDCLPIMLKMMQSTFAGYCLISWLKARGKIGEKAHNSTLILLMAILLIWKKALLPMVSNLICLSKGEHAPTSHPQVWCGFYRI